MGYGDYMPTSGGYHRKRRTGKKMTFADWKKLKKQKNDNKKKEEEEFLELGPGVLAELDELDDELGKNEGLNSYEADLKNKEENEEKIS